MNNKKSVLLLLLICLALYGRTLSWGRSAWDDHIYLGFQPVGRPGISDFIKCFDPSNPAQHFGYRPLHLLSYKIDELIFAGSDFGYRLTQLIYFALTVLLVYRVTKRLLSLVEPKEASRSSATSKFDPSVIALCTAILFAVFPYNLEAVCWLSERKGILACLFMLLATDLDLSYRQSGKIKFLVCATAAFAASILSKSAWVAWPLVATALAFAATDLKVKPSRWLKTALPFYLAISACGVALQLLIGNAQNVMPLGNSFVERVAFAIATYGNYLYCFVNPLGINPVNLWAWNGMSWWRFALGLVFLAGGGAGAIYLFKKGRRLPLAAYAVFVAGLAPVCNLVPMLYPHGDRFLLGASIGIFAPLMYFLFSLNWDQAKKKLAFGLLLIVYAAGAFLGSGYWQNDFTLWDYAANIDPGNQMANYSLGAVYYTLGDKEKARLYLEKAKTAPPGRLFHKGPAEGAQSYLDAMKE